MHPLYVVRNVQSVKELVHVQNKFDRLFHFWPTSQLETQCILYIEITWAARSTRIFEKDSYLSILIPTPPAVVPTKSSYHLSIVSISVCQISKHTRQTLTWIFDIHHPAVSSLDAGGPKKSGNFYSHQCKDLALCIPAQRKVRAVWLNASKVAPRT